MHLRSNCIARVRRGLAVLAALPLVLLAFPVCAVGAGPAGSDAQHGAPATIASLGDLSVETLRRRDYGSTLRIVQRLDGPALSKRIARGRYVAEYRSDGLRVFTRIDVPAAPMPPDGYPAVVFMHGWVSNDEAAAFDFATGADSPSARLIDAFVAAGFVVLYPGFRGYGTVDGRAAEGAEFLTTWNNASYLAPIFFAVDALNLLDGLDSLAKVDWREWGQAEARAVRIDPRRIHVGGHSQGGDVALTVLAVAGEGSRLRTAVASGSIWAGCFATRFRQLETYGPMQSTVEAFMSGDGTWNSTATGADGRVNPNFVFGWPPDSIVTVDRNSPEWTWQNDTWSVPTVAEVLRLKYAEMYATLNRHVADLGGVSVRVETAEDGRARAVHDPVVAAAMDRIGGFGYPQYLLEPLALHASDRDFYSPPEWNQDLSRRIDAAGGRSTVHVYPGNTHSLGVSPHAWFSGPGTRAGFEQMLERDIALFRATRSAARQAAPTLDQLRRGAPAAALTLERELEPGPGFTAYLVSYPSAGLRVYALVAVPTAAMPARGFPVLVANHGTHPNPPRYGFTADGRDSRPGDYYRSVPALYAAQGFVVVMPDYRGHNVSQGGEYARGFLASNYYAEDVLALLSGLPSLAKTDARNVFMWGHSLGGEVTLKALLATDRVRGASLWSTVGGDAWEQAYYYSTRKRDDQPFDSSVLDKDAILALRRDIEQQGPAWDVRGTEPLPRLGDLRTPLILHHARGDEGAPFEWSRELAQELYRHGKPYVFHAYEGADHFFAEPDRRRAAERDAAFFRSLMVTGP
jgi:dienelactone hydrolase